MTPRARVPLARNVVLVGGVAALVTVFFVTRRPALPDRYDELVVRVAGMH